MRQEQIDAIAQDVFALLIGSLRPVARRQSPQGPFDGAERLPPPLQRLDLRLAQQGEEVAAEVRLCVRSALPQAAVFSWVLPLPRGAVVDGLDLLAAGGEGEQGGLCERREARSWFDLARRSGLAGALLSEDAPGVFSLEVSSPGAGGLAVTLRYRYRRADGSGDSLMTVSCEAGAAVAPGARGPARIVRLGAGQRLARLVGIRRDGRGGAAAIERRAVARPEHRPPVLAADVFASCDRGDGASAMFRGTLAGRPVRLWAEMRTPARTAARAEGPEADARIDRLMADYGRAEQSEAERRVLAETVTRLGLEAGVATLWTSFVAVAGSHGPGGEMVFAAA